MYRKRCRGVQHTASVPELAAVTRADLTAWVAAALVVEMMKSASTLSELCMTHMCMWGKVCLHSMAQLQQDREDSRTEGSTAPARALSMD